tara:strand:+ start:845 stop:1258 length:414 start_codon:yes stop_codon:yes gene_type:complete
MPRRSKRGEDGNIFEKGEFVPDFKKLAEQALETFFRDKSWYCGGPIPESEVYSDYSLKMVLRIKLDDNWQKIVHEAVEQLPVDPNWDDPTVPWSIHRLLGILSELRSTGIAHEFHAGLTLLYLKFCEGIQIPPPPLL